MVVGIMELIEPCVRKRLTQYMTEFESAFKERKTPTSLVAAWMMERGFATGHGDTVNDMLDELSWQIAEQAKRNSIEDGHS